MNHTVALMPAWVMSEGSEENNFDLVGILSQWMMVHEYIELSPLDPQMTYGKRVYTQETIRNTLANISGLLIGAERSKPNFLNTVLFEQLSASAAWLSSLSVEETEVLRDSFDETSTLYDLRDKLEYAISAIAYLQLQRPGRFPSIDAHAWFVYLKKVDNDFRPRHFSAKKERWALLDPLAPDNFWWRR